MQKNKFVDKNTLTLIAIEIVLNQSRETTSIMKEKHNRHEFLLETGLLLETARAINLAKDTQKLLV